MTRQLHKKIQEMTPTESLNKVKELQHHYAYRITNLILRKHYYGCRTSRIEPVLDLGKKYFSSSTDENFLKDQKDNPQNYRYKIVRKFSSRKEAILFEIRLHNRFDVGINESFYNKVKQTSMGFDTTGLLMPKSLETKRKIANTLTGRKRPDQTIAKSGAGNPMYGKHGKDNPKSFKYILYNDKREIVNICYGADVMKLVDLYEIPGTLRYLNKPYEFRRGAPNKYKKFVGWELVTIK